MPATYTHLRKAFATVFHHVSKHSGVGIVCAVAYFDPGNWAVDLQAGSDYGFRLLFVVLLAGLFAAFLQVQATRLGCVTGLDLASHCRLLLYDRPKHKLIYRRIVLYPLYFLCEVAIIATDLAELLGSAIALVLLFPKLELWHAVLLTAFDVILLLALRDPLRSTPVRMFELLIAVLVLAVLICMVVVISKVHVRWADAFEGFVPSKTIFGSGALYISVGILGATVMPHSLLLGSTLATQNRVSSDNPLDPSYPKEPLSKTKLLNKAIQFLSASLRSPPPSPHTTRVKRHSDRENNSLAFIQAHLNHARFDVVGSLLGFAILINSMILIISAMVFYYGHDTASSDDRSASLFDVYDVIHHVVGQAAATLFAVALLAAGQSSSLIATVAGQAVAEGFLNWRVSVDQHSFLLIAVIPSMAVAIALGRRGIDTLLVVSQVVLAITLPFIILPLLFFTSSKTVMRVKNPSPSPPTATATVSDAEGDADDGVDYSSGKITTLVGCGIWLIIFAANVFVIVSMCIDARR
ncbi:NRAMP family [Mycena amicta]|nr:NRAMP family [Mycena amicta]